MIIECSNCEKKFKIQEDQLPKGKIVAFKDGTIDTINNSTIYGG